MNLMKIFGLKSGGDEIAAALQNNAVIVDVRTTAEFKQGHIKGSVNIPLDRIEKETDSLYSKGKPVITCCQSGMRSATAAKILQSKKIEAVNGGGWQMLNSTVSDKRNS